MVHGEIRGDYQTFGLSDTRERREKKRERETVRSTRLCLMVLTPKELVALDEKYTDHSTKFEDVVL